MKTTLALVATLLIAAAAEAQWNTNGTNVFYNGGNVGIGTSTPNAELQVFKATSDVQMRFQTGGTTKYAYGRFAIPANSTVNDTQAGFFFEEGAGNYTVGNRYFAFGFNPVTDAFVILGGDAPTQRLTIKANGNVGIGTASPTALLDVNGDINVTGNIAAKYQDFAEWVPSTNDLAPGTVVVLNLEKSNEVMASMKPYDSAVAGVVSDKPGVLLGEGSATKEKVATSGRVKVRVDATKTPIHIGDLLVTSDKPGFAMKSIPVEVAGVQMHRPGTIVGKALESISSGEGEILVLLSLQ